MQVHKIVALNAITAAGAATSQKIFVGDYDHVAILFEASGISSGNGAFTVKAGFGEYASDVPTMYAYNMLVDNATNTNAQQKTRVNGKTLSSNTGAMVWVEEDQPISHLEIDLTVTTDGSYTATIIGFQED